MLATRNQLSHIERWFGPSAESRTLASYVDEAISLLVVELMLGVNKSKPQRKKAVARGLGLKASLMFHDVIPIPITHLSGRVEFLLLVPIRRTCVAWS